VRPSNWISAESRRLRGSVIEDVAIDPRVPSAATGEGRSGLCECVAVQIRLRAEADLDSCVRVAEAVRGIDRYPAYLTGSLHDFLASEDALAAWVAERDGEIVGHVALHRRSSDAVLALASACLGQPSDRLAVVARLFVAPAERGKGFGRSLLNVATQDALARGLWPILDTLAAHAASVRLYENCGWLRAGVVTTKLRDGVEFEEIVFLGPRPSTT